MFFLPLNFLPLHTRIKVFIFSVFFVCFFVVSVLPSFPWQRGDDRLLQQLLPDVRARPAAGRHAGGVAGEQQAAAGPQAAEGLHRRQAQEGRDQRGQLGLQQENPPHRLASTGQHHRRGNHEQPLHIPG